MPLLVFGASDADTHFRPFGVSLTSSDEDSTCFITLFNQLKCLSMQHFNRPYFVNYIMADGATGKLFFNLFIK